VLKKSRERLRSQRKILAAPETGLFAHFGILQMV
jgi:hypothetical protein